MSLNLINNYGFERMYISFLNSGSENVSLAKKIRKKHRDIVTPKL